MKKALHLLGPAEAEMVEAAKYYETQCRGLGHRFLDEVENIASSIVALPCAGPVVRGRMRRRLLPHFPFALVYIVEVKEILVVAVVDLRRKPGYWLNR